MFGCLHDAVVYIISCQFKKKSNFADMLDAKNCEILEKEIK